MPESSVRKNHRPSLFRSIAKTMFHITLPPLAGRYHGRYQGKPHHLALDTLLAIGMFVFAGIAAWALLRQTPEILSGVRLSIDMPGKVQSGEKIRVTFRLQNTKATARNLRLRINTSERWDIIAPTDNEGVIWTQDSLAADASTTMSLDAMITGMSGQPYLLRANIHYSIHGTEFTNTAIAQYSVDTSAITAKLELPDTAIAGETVDGALNIQNNNSWIVPEITAALSLPDGVTLLSADPPLDRIAHPLVVFTPGQTFTVALRLFVAPTFANTSATVTATTLLRKIPQSSDTKTMLVIRQTASDVELRAEPVYWSNAGIQFGYGPLPPKVGERTGYRIFWTVKAGTHALAQGTVRARLPASVTWQNNATATAGDQPSYSASDRTVEWQFQRVAAMKQVSASFDVSVQPVSSDRGKSLLLLGPSELMVILDNGNMSASVADSIRNILADKDSPSNGRVEP
mgnify:CR=1 FL=1